MEVRDVTATSASVQASSPQSQQPASANEKQPEKQPENQQESAVVKLSAQAQQMNRAENQNTERVETGPHETAEPPGIKFMEGESKGGNVNTFA